MKVTSIEYNIVEKCNKYNGNHIKT